MKLAPIRAASCLLCTMLLAVASHARAEDKRSADQLLPPSTILYAELTKPAELLDTLLNHPLRAKAEKLDVVQDAYESPQFAQLEAVRALVEQQLEMNWKEAIASLAQGGVSVAFDSKTNGVALLAKAANAKVLEKSRDTFLKLAQADAKKKDRDSPIKKREYRSVKVYGVDGGYFATIGPWLLATNKGALGREMVDLYLDGGDRHLGKKSSFAAARTSIQGQPAAWAYADVKAIRASGLAKDAFKQKTDNIVAEMVFGGILSTLKETPFATASLYVSSKQVKLALATPHKQAWQPKARSYFFGESGRASAPPLLQPKQTVLALSVHRDLGRMWSSAPDLMTEKANAELAKGEGNLSTLFSGRDIGRDILGATKPEIQLVVARQEFGEERPTPKIKLPSFGIVFRLKDPNKTQRQLKVSFQSLVGFLNIVGAQQGQPQFELGTERKGGAQLATAKYFVEEKDKKSGRINYNFSPTIGFVKDRFIVSSTRQLVDQLLSADVETNGAAKSNTHARLDVAALRDVLSDNRSQLVANNMLKKGQTRAEAQGEIDIVLKLMSWVKDASLQLGVQQDQLRLELAVDTE